MTPKLERPSADNVSANGREAIIFSIEEFAVNDGPGIRTTIFFKGCPLHCAWCHNPEGISPEPQYLAKNGHRELCGYRVGVSELAERIKRNAAIYAMNEGGITLTGGEPFLQGDFIVELLRAVKPEINTAVETSGYASSRIFRQALPLLDYVLFDIKQMNPALHKRYTGVSNKIILKNLDILCASQTHFFIRVPLIPGVNDTRQDMRAICEAIKGADNLVRVELLRYNKMAGAKYPMLGLTYDPPFDTKAEPRVFIDIFEDYGIKAIAL